MTPATNLTSNSFTCSICEEPSQQICVWCTKDACDNHICAKCGRCSDCCTCESLGRDTARAASGNS